MNRSRAIAEERPAPDTRLLPARFPLLQLRLDPLAAVVPALGAQQLASLQVWRDTAGELCAYARSTSREHRMFWPGLGQFRFDAQGDAAGDEVFVTPHPPPRVAAIEDTFYRSVLPLALQARGWEALHASAVSTAKGVIAFCASSETGKTTTACALSRIGYPLWADDALVFSAHGDSFEAIPIPFRPRLSQAAAAYLAPAGALPTERAAPADAPVPLAGICLLERHETGDAEARPTVAALAPGSALSGLLTHAHCFDPANRERTQLLSRRYLRLIGTVPCFRAVFTAGFDRLPEFVEQLERELLQPIGGGRPCAA